MEMEKDIKQALGKHSLNWVHSFLPGREAESMYGKSSIADTARAEFASKAH